MGWIYIFFNLINHKVYIGKWQGTRVETRRDQHKNGKGSPLLYADIIEYGWGNFIFDTLHENVPIEMLKYLERKEIARFDCNECAGGWGYNQNKGGGGRTVQTSETRQKISENNRQQLADGTHPFLDSDFHRKHAKERGKINSKAQRQRLADGTHPFLDSDFHRENARQQLADGTHPFLDSEKARARNLKRVEDGTHPFQRENNPRARPEYMQARWEFFLSYPLGIKEARTQLYKMFDNVPQRTIRDWVREWKGEIGAV